MVLGRAHHFGHTLGIADISGVDAQTGGARLGGLDGRALVQDHLLVDDGDDAQVAFRLLAAPAVFTAAVVRAQAGEAPLVLLANNNVPGADYAAVMAAVAKDPKKFFVAISSGGSAGHIATLAWIKRTGLPIDTILYKGTAPANTDLMAGTVQFFMDPWTALLPLASTPSWARSWRTSAACCSDATQGRAADDRVLPATD